jgi:ketosteroid isomerase-like protein
MKRVVLIAVALLLGACAPSPDAIEQQVRDLEQAQASAAVAGDKVALEQIFAPDFRMINPAGAMTSRAELLALLGSGNPPYRKAVYETDSVVMLGSDAAMSTGTESVEYAADGRPQQRRVTQVWKKNPAGWQLLLRQATLVNPAAAAPPVTPSN